MDIAVSTADGVTVAAISGRIDSATAAACEARLAEALALRPSGMVLDMAKVDYLSSAGIRAVLLIYKRAAAKARKVALARPQDHVSEVLKVTGLDNVLTVRPSLEAAILAVRDGGASP